MSSVLRIKLGTSKQQATELWQPVVVELIDSSAGELSNYSIDCNQLQEDPKDQLSYVDLPGIDPGTYQLRLRDHHRGSLLHQSPPFDVGDDDVVVYDTAADALGTRQANTAGMDMVVDAPYRIEESYPYLPIVIYLKDIKEGRIKLKSIKLYQRNKACPDQWIPLPEEAISHVLDVDGSTVSQSGNPSILRLEPGQERETIRTVPWYRIVMVDKRKLCPQQGEHLAHENVTFVEYMIRIRYKGLINHKREFVLRTLLPEADLPRCPGWHYGDAHYHSEFTDNPYEYGGPLRVTAKAARALGLSWVTVTDHSYGLSRPKNDNEEALGNRWQAYHKAISDMNTDYQDLLLVAAEEITVRERVWGLHLLSFGNDFVRDTHVAGFGTLTMAEMFDKLIQSPDSNPGFIYAAHPSSSGYMWKDEDYATALDSDYANQFVGLQLFNEKVQFSTKTARTMDRKHLAPFEMLGEDDRKRPWSEELRAGIRDHWVDRLLVPSLKAVEQGKPLRKFFALAGSDCHMDFNLSFRPHPAFLIHHLNDNAFGKVRSLAYVPDDGSEMLSEARLLSALRSGKVLLTDGPVVLVTVSQPGSQDRFMMGETATIPIGANLELHVEWKSTPDFGLIEDLKIYLGTPTGEVDLSEKIRASICDKMASELESQASHIFDDWSPGPCYLRIEAAASVDPESGEAMYACYSNPIWIVND
jgi:hypothetical protein